MFMIYFPSEEQVNNYMLDIPVTNLLLSGPLY